MSTGVDGVARHDVLRGLALVRDGLGLIGGAAGWSLSDDEARAALLEATSLRGQVHAAYLKLLADAARRDDPAAGEGKTGPETTAWLAAEANVSAGRVRTDLADALALDPDSGDLRGLGALLWRGAVSPEHTRVAVGALAGIPVAVRRERSEDVDRLLTEHAMRFAPPTTRKLAQHLLATIDPERAERFDRDADQRRELRMHQDGTGMWLVRGQLTPDCGAGVKSILDHLGAPHRGPAQDETGKRELAVLDRRSPAERNHDALAEMARLAAGSAEAGGRVGEPPRVVVHTTPEQLAAARYGASAFTKAPPGPATCEASGPIGPHTLARLACDAVVERVLLSEHGKILELTSLGRFFTPAQRRALAARDGGCAWPSCDRPASWTDAHHIRYWTDGGPTTVDNGVLLCEPHHTTVHHGEWQIVMRDGVPWFVPPARIDPLRRPLRNT
ncbi:MAG TPA: DUF222 domain-containing protein, partial [Actinomycetales bacterium]|nr:DUF222 domain-containing protein [Actinomycetales bacterium]